MYCRQIYVADMLNAIVYKYFYLNGYQYCQNITNSDNKGPKIGVMVDGVTNLVRWKKNPQRKKGRD